MGARESQQLEDNAAAIIARVRAKNVSLWAEDGELRYRAPKGALAPSEIDELRRHKTQLVLALRSSGESSAIRYAPLTHLQLAHWYVNGLAERASLRSLASAIRLQGAIDVRHLHRTIDEIVRRHDALRTQIVIVNEVPKQRISRSVSHKPEFVDLTSLPEPTRSDELQRLLEEYILQPIDVARTSLFGSLLLRVGLEEHVLFLAMEHIVSDAGSLNILFREILDGYTGRAQDTLSRSPVAVQFPDFALWQMQRNQLWVDEHGKYWTDRMAGAKPTRFPEDSTPQSHPRRGWLSESVQADTDLRRRLSSWCEAHRTSLAMSVFCAYAALTLRWCSTSDAVLGYQISGRFDPRVQNTVGYFASTLYLRIQISAEGRLIDLLSQITDEYCRAYEHADSGYLETQRPPPHYVGTSAFSWSPHETDYGLDRTGDTNRSLTVTQLQLAHPGLATHDWDLEPIVACRDLGDCFLGSVNFQALRFQPKTMRRYARNLLLLIETLINMPTVCVADIRLQ